MLAPSMRFVIATVVLASLACSGPAWDGCQAVCEGGFPGDTQYRRDGGPCPLGGAAAERYNQCICMTSAGQLQSFVFVEPETQAACDSARADWRAFRTAVCH